MIYSFLAPFMYVQHDLVYTTILISLKDLQVYSMKLHVLCRILHIHILDMVPPIYCEYMYATVSSALCVL